MNKILEGLGNVAKGVAGVAVAGAAIGITVYASILEEKENLEKEIAIMEIDLERKKKRLAEIKGA